MSLISQINNVNNTASKISSSLNALKSGSGVSLLKAAGLNVGSIFGISGTKMALIKMIGLNLDKFKNKPLAVLDSLATSICPKVLTLKSGLSMINNMMKGMNLTVGDMLKNTAFKSALNKAGIPTSVIDKVDVSKCNSIEDFTNQVTELGKGIISPTLNVAETVTGLFKDPADFAKMFAPDKILTDALSEVSDTTFGTFSKFFNTAGISTDVKVTEGSDWR